MRTLLFVTGFGEYNAQVVSVINRQGCLSTLVGYKMQGFQNKLLKAGGQREEFFCKNEKYVGSFFLKASDHLHNQ
jgi:hypothetical protein